MLRAQVGAKILNAHRAGFATRAAAKSVVNFDKFTRVLRSPHEDVEIPKMTLSDFIWRDVSKRTNQNAMICGVSGRQYTFGEAKGASCRVGMVLSQHFGLKSGEVIALVLPNMPEFPIIFMGAASAGLITTPANPLYTEEELARQFSLAKVRAVVTVANHLEKVQAALKQVPGGAGPVILVGEGKTREEDGTVNIYELMGKRYDETLIERLDPESVVVLPFSSGTTGMPKGVMLSHKNMVANICQMQHPEVCPPTPPGLEFDRALAILPFFHIYGMNGMMNMSLSLGRSMMTLPKFETTTFSSAFRQFKPTVLSIVPPLCSYLAQGTPIIAAKDLAHLRFVTCGAAAAQKSSVQNLLKKGTNPNLDFKEGYGLTETSCLVSSPPSSTPMEERYGTVGVPIPQTEIKIINHETGETLRMGDSGEILVRGPQVMQGYLFDEEATRETLTPDGWLRTGDIGFVKENGFLSIVDRIKELIKVKGLQVSPTELESILATMDGVLDVAVVGVPDEVYGELPKAYVVKKPDSEIGEEDVMGYLEPHVAHHKRLKGGVRFISEIPKNAAGKVMRTKLKKF